MKPLELCFLWAWMLSGVLPAVAQQPDLKAQLTYSRVRESKSLTDTMLRRQFAAKRLAYPAQKILLRIFKAEQQVEIWVSRADTMALFDVYPFCYLSGVLGPKRHQGDLQVPEGLYYINDYNPNSSFHLSMGLSYPNPSDRLLKTKPDPGGSIYIHGYCVSIGCVPMEDRIQSLYWLCVQSRQKVQVHCFPARGDGPHLAKALQTASPGLSTFWASLMVFEQEFDRTHRIPRFRIDEKGVYRLLR